MVALSWLSMHRCEAVYPLATGSPLGQWRDTRVHHVGPGMSRHGTWHIWGGNNFLVGQIEADKVERLYKTSEQVSTDGKN